VPAQEQQQRAVLSPLPDIDGPDRHNPLAECQYVNDIYGYFRYIEPKYRAPANYMESQVR
jgi:cyclin B